MNIHHFHIHKTGGKSIFSVFHRYCQDRGLRWTRTPEKYSKGMKGKFFFSTSHATSDIARIPKYFYRFTVFRDPFLRLVSFYNALVYGKRHPFALSDKSLIETASLDNFNSFIASLPKFRLFSELFMFSKTGDLKESIYNIKKLNRVLWLEELQYGLDKISSDLDLELPNVGKEGGRHYLVSVDPKDYKHILCLLKPSYQLLEAINLTVP